MEPGSGSEYSHNGQDGTARVGTLIFQSYPTMLSDIGTPFRVSPIR